MVIKAMIVPDSADCILLPTLYCPSRTYLSRLWWTVLVAMIINDVLIIL